MYAKGDELSPFTQESDVIAESANAYMRCSDKSWLHFHQRPVVALSGLHE